MRKRIADVQEKGRNLEIGLVAVAVLIAAGEYALATPPYFQKLIDTGNVEFEFYDPRSTRHEHRGHTQFHLHVANECSFHRRWEVNRRRQHLTITLRIVNITYRLTNTIRLPERFDSDSDWRWNHSLVRHEFDHVAMSTDPRVRMLIEHLYGGIRKIERTLPLGKKIDDRLTLDIVDEEIAPLRKAVLEALLANQNLLDDVTRHGVRPIPDRAVFFRSLFTGANLREIEFPYLVEVADLVKTRAYRDVELPYRLKE